jgi:hypothetical protein
MRLGRLSKTANLKVVTSGICSQLDEQHAPRLVVIVAIENNINNNAS